MKNLSKKKFSSRDITRLIKEGLIYGREKREPRRTDHFFGREGSGCALRVYLRRLGFPEQELEPDKLSRFTDLGLRGEMLESLVLNAFGNVHCISERQARCSKESTFGDTSITVVGRCDGLFIGPNGTKYGLEVKSVGTEHYKELRSFLDVVALRPSYVAQCNIYNWLFDTQSFFLIIVNRDDSQFRCFEIKCSGSETVRLLQRLVSIEKKITEKDPPNPEPEIPCYFCPYWKYCPAFGGEVTAGEEDILTDSTEEVRLSSTEVCCDSSLGREPVQSSPGESHISSEAHSL